MPDTSLIPQYHFNLWIAQGFKLFIYKTDSPTFMTIQQCYSILRLSGRFSLRLCLFAFESQYAPIAFQHTKRLHSIKRRNFWNATPLRWTSSPSLPMTLQMRCQLTGHETTKVKEYIEGPKFRREVAGGYIWGIGNLFYFPVFIASLSMVTSVLEFHKFSNFTSPPLLLSNPMPFTRTGGLALPASRRPFSLHHSI